MVIKRNLILILITAAAFFLRTVRIDYLELFGDEADAGYQAYSLLNTGRDYKGHFLPVYAQSFSEYRAPGMMYAMIPFIRIFGLNEWGVRLPAAVFGVSSIILFYLLLGEVKVDRKIRLWTVVFLAVNPWQIQYSRAAFELTFMATWLLLGILLLIKSIKNGRLIMTAAAALSLSLAIYTYNTANVFVPLFSVLTLIYFKAGKRQVITLAATGIVFCLPIIFSLIWGHAGDRFATLSLFNSKEITAEVNDYRNKNGNSAMSKILFNKLTVGGKRWLFNYTNAFSSDFLFRSGDVTFRHSLHQIGNLYWIMLPLVILGLISADKYLIWLTVLAPIPSSLTIDGFNHASRLFMLVFPLAYLAAAGLTKLKLPLKSAVIGVLIFEFVNYQYYYWNDYRNESWRWWHYGYKETMKYVSDNHQDFAKIYINNTYEPALIRYLFWTKTDPEKVFNLRDDKSADAGGFKGFCLNQKTCFVSFGTNVQNSISRGNLYIISQEKDIGGNWDWEKNPPAGIKVLKTVRNFDGQPIFYAVTGNS